MTENNLVCWRCGQPMQADIPMPFPRLEKCCACEADLHVCRQCRHYAPRYNTGCDNDVAEPVRETDIANFCHYFSPAHGAYQAKGAGEAEAARDNLADLFGEEPESDTSPLSDSSDGAESDALRDLFGENSDGGS